MKSKRNEKWEKVISKLPLCWIVLILFELQESEDKRLSMDQTSSPPAYIHRKKERKKTIKIVFFKSISSFRNLVGLIVKLKRLWTENKKNYGTPLPSDVTDIDHGYSISPGGWLRKMILDCLYQPRGIFKQLINCALLVRQQTAGSIILLLLSKFSRNFSTRDRTFTYAELQSSSYLSRR